MTVEDVLVYYLDNTLILEVIYLHALNGLIKKDLKLGIPVLYTMLLIMGLGIITVIGLAVYYKSFVLVPVLTIALCFVHIFFLPSFLLTLLNIEGKTQLWLHNPNSSMKLLLSKWIAGFLFSLLSLSIAFIAAVISIGKAGEFQLAFNQFDLFLMCLVVLGISIYFSSWIFFYWTLYHSMKRVRWMYKIRWILLIFIWNGWNMAVYWFNQIPIIDTLKKKSVITIDHVFAFKANQNSFHASIESTDLSIFTLLGYLLAFVAAFFAASWLLEKKVEV